MWKTIVITAAGAAAVVGVGTAALASSPTSANLASIAAATAPAAGSTSAPAGRPAKGDLLKRISRVAHATWVTRAKDGKYVTHDAIRGTVTAVSASSITVKAGDGFTQTYSVSAATKVRIRTTDKGAAAQITDVKIGQNALVSGTGTGTGNATLAAEHVVAGLPK